MALLNYCDKCKSDLERIELGYNPQNPPCDKWQCKMLDLVDTLFLLIIILPIFILLLPIILFITIIVTIKIIIFG